MSNNLMSNSLAEHKACIFLKIITSLENIYFIRIIEDIKPFQLC